MDSELLSLAAVIAFLLKTTGVLLAVGLWNADLLLSEKGFYGMSFLLSLFAAIAVQKNTRDSLGRELPAKHDTELYF